MKACILKQGYIVCALDLETDRVYKVRKFVKEQDAKDFAKFDLPSYSDAEIRKLANDYDPSEFYERHQNNGIVTYDYKVRCKIDVKDGNLKFIKARPEEYADTKTNASGL